MGDPLNLNHSRSKRARWRNFLPWREPERQAVTTGTWGWFPNIPRNWFGRVVWLLLVGGVSVAFGVFATVILIGLISRSYEGVSLGGGILAFALVVSGCLIFAWHLLNGIALARAEHMRLRELRAEAAQVSDRVEAARRRILR